jgi:hypothetical protein
MQAAALLQAEFRRWAFFIQASQNDIHAFNLK